MNSPQPMPPTSTGNQSSTSLSAIRMHSTSLGPTDISARSNSVGIDPAYYRGMATDLVEKLHATQKKMAAYAQDEKTNVLELHRLEHHLHILVNVMWTIIKKIKKCCDLKSDVVSSPSPPSQRGGEGLEGLVHLESTSRNGGGPGGGDADTSGIDDGGVDLDPDNNPNPVPKGLSEAIGKLGSRITSVTRAMNECSDSVGTLHDVWVDVVARMRAPVAVLDERMDGLIDDYSAPTDEPRDWDADPNEGGVGTPSRGPYAHQSVGGKTSSGGKRYHTAASARAAAKEAAMPSMMVHQGATAYPAAFISLDETAAMLGRYLDLFDVNGSSHAAYILKNYVAPAPSAISGTGITVATAAGSEMSALKAIQPLRAKLTECVTSLQQKLQEEQRKTTTLMTSLKEYGESTSVLLANLGCPPVNIDSLLRASNDQSAKVAAWQRQYEDALAQSTWVATGLTSRIDAVSMTIGSHVQGWVPPMNLSTGDSRSERAMAIQAAADGSPLSEYDLTTRQRAVRLDVEKRLDALQDTAVTMCAETERVKMLCNECVSVTERILALAPPLRPVGASKAGAASPSSNRSRLPSGGGGGASPTVQVAAPIDIDALWQRLKQIDEYEGALVQRLISFVPLLPSSCHAILPRTAISENGRINPAELSTGDILDAIGFTLRRAVSVIDPTGTKSTAASKASDDGRTSSSSVAPGHDGRAVSGALMTAPSPGRTLLSPEVLKDSLAIIDETFRLGAVTDGNHHIPLIGAAWDAVLKYSGCAKGMTMPGTPLSPLGGTRGFDSLEEGGSDCLHDAVELLERRMGKLRRGAGRLLASMVQRTFILESTLNAVGVATSSASPWPSVAAATPNKEDSRSRPNVQAPQFTADGLLEYINSFGATGAPPTSSHDNSLLSYSAPASGNNISSNNLMIRPSSPAGSRRQASAPVAASEAPVLFDMDQLRVVCDALIEKLEKRQQKVNESSKPVVSPPTSPSRNEPSIATILQAAEEERYLMQQAHLKELTAVRSSLQTAKAEAKKWEDLLKVRLQKLAASLLTACTEADSGKVPMTKRDLSVGSLDVSSASNSSAGVSSSGAATVAEKTLHELEAATERVRSLLGSFVAEKRAGRVRMDNFTESSRVNKRRIERIREDTVKVLVALGGTPPAPASGSNSTNSSVASMGNGYDGGDAGGEVEAMLKWCVQVLSAVVASEGRQPSPSGASTALVAEDTVKNVRSLHDMQRREQQLVEAIESLSGDHQRSLQLLDVVSSRIRNICLGLGTSIDRFSVEAAAELSMLPGGKDDPDTLPPTGEEGAAAPLDPLEATTMMLFHRVTLLDRLITVIDDTGKKLFTTLQQGSSTILSAYRNITGCGWEIQEASVDDIALSIGQLADALVLSTNEGSIIGEILLEGRRTGRIPSLSSPVRTPRTSSGDAMENSGDSDSIAVGGGGGRSASTSNRLSLPLGAPTHAALPALCDHRLLRVGKSIHRIFLTLCGIESVRYLSLNPDPADPALLMKSVTRLAELVMPQNNNNSASTPSHDSVVVELESSVSAMEKALEMFSTNYKQAAVAIQRDIDTMQTALSETLGWWTNGAPHFLATLLEPTAEEVKNKNKSFMRPQDVEELVQRLSVPRRMNQRGMYFFHLQGTGAGGSSPQGHCPWKKGVELLNFLVPMSMEQWTGDVSALEKITDVIAEDYLAVMLTADDDEEAEAVAVNNNGGGGGRPPVSGPPAPKQRADEDDEEELEKDPAKAIQEVTARIEMARTAMKEIVARARRMSTRYPPREGGQQSGRGGGKENAGGNGGDDDQEDRGGQHAGAPLEAEQVAADVYSIVQQSLSLYPTLDRLVKDNKHLIRLEQRRAVEEPRLAALEGESSLLKERLEQAELERDQAASEAALSRAQLAAQAKDQKKVQSQLQLLQEELHRQEDLQQQMQARMDQQMAAAATQRTAVESIDASESGDSSSEAGDAYYAQQAGALPSRQPQPAPGSYPVYGSGAQQAAVDRRLSLTNSSTSLDSEVDRQRRHLQYYASSEPSLPMRSTSASKPPQYLNPTIATQLHSRRPEYTLVPVNSAAATAAANANGPASHGNTAPRRSTPLRDVRGTRGQEPTMEGLVDDKGTLILPAMQPTEQAPIPAGESAIIEHWKSVLQKELKQRHLSSPSAKGSSSHHHAHGRSDERAASAGKRTGSNHSHRSSPNRRLLDEPEERVLPSRGAKLYESVRLRDSAIAASTNSSLWSADLEPRKAGASSGAGPLRGSLRSSANTSLQQDSGRNGGGDDGSAAQQHHWVRMASPHRADAYKIHAAPHGRKEDSTSAATPSKADERQVPSQIPTRRTLANGTWVNQQAERAEDRSTASKITDRDLRRSAETALEPLAEALMLASNHRLPKRR